MRKHGHKYEYIAVYVDDLTLAMENPDSFVDLLKAKYNFHFKGTGPLAFHLGIDFYRNQHGTLSKASRKYIERLTNNYECMFGEKPKMNVYSLLEKGNH